MLPSLSGFEVLRRLRHSLSVPVIMLTAHGADVDRIVGLELGADDYLSKPFNPRELVARVRAVLRRFSPRDTDMPAHPVSVGPLRLDPATFEVTLSGQSVRLTGTELRLLEVLMRAVGQVQSRESLTERVLGRRLTPYDRSIDTHVSNLRRKLGLGENGLPEIRSIRGAGYVLIASRRGARDPRETRPHEIAVPAHLPVVLGGDAAGAVRDRGCRVVSLQSGAERQHRHQGAGERSLARACWSAACRRCRTGSTRPSTAIATDASSSSTRAATTLRKRKLPTDLPQLHRTPARRRLPR